MRTTDSRRSDSKQVRNWLLDVARPVLKPLGASVAFRHVDQFAGLGLLAIGAGSIARLASDLTGSPEAGPAWLPSSAAMLALTLIVISLVKGLTRYLEHFFGHLVAFKALELLRVRLFRALVPQTPALMQRSTSGDLLVRATKDIDRIEVFFAHTFPPAVTAVTVPVAGVLVIAGVGSWPLALAAAIGLALSLLVPLLGASMNQAAAQQVAAARGTISQHITDSMQGMAEVTGYGHVTRRLDELANLDEQVARAQQTRGRVQATRDGLQVVIVGLTTLVVAVLAIGLGVDLVSAAIAVALTWRLFDSTSAVKDFMASLDTSMVAAERVHRIATAPPLIADPDSAVDLPPGPLGISWEHLGYRYPSEANDREPALQDVSITAPAGTHLLLTGHSGCGKSTLLHLVLRYDDPTSGRVLIGGVDARQIAGDQLRSRVALIDQTPFLFHGSIADNLRIAAPEATDEQLREALHVAQLDDEIHQMPDGLGTQVGERGQRLSGGQQQRLALARALLIGADILLLDEFTSHLDTELAARVRQALRAARPDATIIESAHLFDTVDADQIVRLDAGRLLGS